MPRIAKSDVHAALQRAASRIVEAGGQDQRVSRADMATALGGLQGTEKQLVDIFFRFIDHRDYQPGATVTASDVERAVEYAKQHLIDKYDLNNNGLSKAEIAEMSRTGQLAVQLARELKHATPVQQEPWSPVQGPDDSAPVAPRPEVPAASAAWFEIGLSQMFVRNDLLQPGFKQLTYINHTQGESKTYQLSAGNLCQGTTRRPGDDVEIKLQGDAGERSFRFTCAWDRSKYGASTHAYFTVDEFNYSETSSQD